MKTHRGHCRCEGVVVEISGDPVLSVFCHCDDCRRSAGAPVIASVGFEKDGIKWQAMETLERWTKGTCSRLFCKRCGSPIAQEHESAPAKTFFNTAFMDRPEDFPPTYHTFEGQQLPWLELADQLSRHEKTVLIKTE